MKTGQRGQSMSCCAAKATNRGKGFPLGAPCGVACGQALQPCGLTGGLPTGSRLRRACTPFLIEKFPGNPKPITIQAHSRAPLPRHGSTYLSGNAVQTNRATSVQADQGVSWESARCVLEWLRQHEIKTLNVAGPRESKRPGIYRLTRELLSEVDASLS